MNVHDNDHHLDNNNNNVHKSKLFEKKIKLCCERIWYNLYTLEHLGMDGTRIILK
jgi:hypothetical protein